MIASMSKSSSSNKACFQSLSSCPLVGLLLVDHFAVGFPPLEKEEGRIEVVLLQLLLLGPLDGRMTNASTPGGSMEEQEKRRRVVVVVKIWVAATTAAAAVEARTTLAAWPPRRCRVAGLARMIYFGNGVD